MIFMHVTCDLPIIYSMNFSCFVRSMTSQKPTYGELIEMLLSAEEEAKINGESISELLLSIFRRRYPHISIGRASRFYDTVRRIAAPTQSSTRLRQLDGSPLRSYLKRVWMPRIRNTQQGNCINKEIEKSRHYLGLLFTGSTPLFPVLLQKYGLTENILMEGLLQCSQGHKLKVDIKWSLKEVPTVGFYRELHNFLRKWPLSRSMTKVAIGRFYTCIDPQLYYKNMCSRPDNVYQFIERVALSEKPFSAPMSYGHDATLKHLRKKVCVSSNDVNQLSCKVMAQQEEITEMKREVEIAKAEVSDTKCALQEVMHQLQIAEKQRDIASTKVQKCQEELEVTIDDFVHFEDKVLSRNEELTKVVCELKSEIADLSSSTVSLLGNSTEQSVFFCFQTKDDGKVYSHAIRQLYYSLLANQIPPGKIKSTIKAVLGCFFPSLNLDCLQLPSESCAAYMRRHELTTLSLAHKATSVLKQAETGMMHLNTDGTTKFQKKIEGAALSGMVLSINEVADGSADSMVEDIS